MVLTWGRSTVGLVEFTVHAVSETLGVFVEDCELEKLERVINFTLRGPALLCTFLALDRGELVPFRDSCSIELVFCTDL